MKHFHVLLSVLLAGSILAGCSKNGFKPGTYTGTAKGMDGDVTVDVTFSKNAITSIEIKDDNETAGVGEKALGVIRDEIMARQSLNVDTVSGATISSGAMKGAVSKAITLAGGDPATFGAKKEELKAADATYDYDVVVAGAGLAGLMAAYKAESAGAKVALLEKEGLVGGTSIFSSGSFIIAPTADKVPAAVNSWLSRNTIQDKNPVDKARVSSMLARGPEIIALLDATGLKYSFDKDGVTFHPAASDRSKKNASFIKLASKNAMSKGGAALIDAIEKKITADGVVICLNTPVTSLITAADGSVTGVISKGTSGTKTFNAKAVVLATGDYAWNKEMTDKYCPDASGNYTASAVGNTGDGHQLAMDAGAVMYKFQESMSGVFAPDPYDMPTVGEPNNSYPFECLLLSPEGKRVVSEAAGSHSQMIKFVNSSSDPEYGWVVMDQETASKFLNLDTYLTAAAGGNKFIVAYKESSVEKLAADMGLDASILKASIDRYNGMCKAGKDTDFGKDAKYLSAIDDGTYYAVKEYDLTRGNYGGIVTDRTGAVLKADNSAIPHLYAAGVISSGPYFGDFYPGREALALAAQMGFTAGESAAADAAKK